VSFEIAIVTIFHTHSFQLWAKLTYL